MQEREGEFEPNAILDLRLRAAQLASIRRRLMRIITQLFGGDVRFVRASSGHVSGVINPPGGKGAYWTREKDDAASSPEQWLQSATRHNGSWWTDWSAWPSTRSGRKVAPPLMGGKKHPPPRDAPGSCILEK